MSCENVSRNFLKTVTLRPSGVHTVRRIYNILCTENVGGGERGEFIKELWLTEYARDGRFIARSTTPTPILVVLLRLCATTPVPYNPDETTTVYCENAAPHRVIVKVFKKRMRARRS